MSDVTSDFLQSLRSPMVITCRDKPHPEIKELCRQLGLEYIWFNIGHVPTHKSEGDEVVVKAPGGDIYFEIDKVRHV